MFHNSYMMTVNWADCDPAGIVYYPNFFRFYDAATTVLMEAALGLSDAEARRTYGVVGWPMRDTRSTFLRPCRFGDHLVVTSEITRLGGSSFDVTHHIDLDGHRAAIGVEARVWATLDPHAKKPLVALRIPDAVRASLLRVGPKARTHAPSR